MPWAWSKLLAGGYRPFRVLLLSATFVSIGLLCARRAGVTIPVPLIWLGWGVIEVKVALKLAELATFLYERKRGGRPSSSQAGRLNPFLALLLVETRIVRGFIASWKPNTAVPEGFTFSKGPEYQSLIYVLWISILLELPFMFLMLQIVPVFAPQRATIDAIVLVSSAYILLAFRADKHAVRYTAHSFTDNHLVLQMGLRVVGNVSLGDIVSAEPVRLGTWRPLARKWRLDGTRVAKISPLDKPNVVMKVRPESVELSWIYGGASRPRYIGLYVDDAHKFLSHLRAACPQLTVAQAAASSPIDG